MDNPLKHTQTGSAERQDWRGERCQQKKKRPIIRGRVFWRLTINKNYGSYKHSQTPTKLLIIPISEQFWTTTTKTSLFITGLSVQICFSLTLQISLSLQLVKAHAIWKRQKKEDGFSSGTRSDMQDEERCQLSCPSQYDHAYRESRELWDLSWPPELQSDQELWHLP